MMFFYAGVQEPLIRCLLRFGDRLDEGALRRAVELSMDAAPQLRCTFDEARFSWREARFSAADALRIEAVPDGSDPAPFMLSSIDWTRMPQLQVRVLREAARDSLAFTVNHMVMDGAGFKQFLYLVAGLYAKCAADPACEGPATLPGQRGLGQVLRNLPILERLKILAAPSDSAKPDLAMRLPLVGDAARPTLVVSRVDEARFEVIRRCAKERGASVNDVFLAAYLRALRSFTGCARVAVPCPVDLRRFARPGQICGICNLTGSFSCGADIGADEAFYETLAKVAETMRAQKEKSGCFKGPTQFCVIDRLLPHRVVRKLFLKLAPPPVIGYTNIGVLDEARLRFGSHEADDAFFATAVKKTPYFQLSVSTYRGSCTLSSSLYATEEDEKTVRKMHAQIIRDMADAAKNVQNIPDSDC
jgi:NRPS condensation-like uncharacterized protein